jgi:hypothetical protein
LLGCLENRELGEERGRGDRNIEGLEEEEEEDEAAVGREAREGEVSATTKEEPVPVSDDEEDVVRINRR